MSNQTVLAGTISRQAGGRAAVRPLRADARRNRERLLDVAIEVILEVGGEPPRDLVAERAQVGSGTLYRHFPDRQSLLKAVVQHALERTIQAGEAALSGSADSFQAVRQYMHAAVDNGVGVVNLISPLLDNRQSDLRPRALLLMRTLIERGHHDGSLRKDASVDDIVFATVRFGRPLAMGLSAAKEKAIAHRQIDIYLEGLRASGNSPASPTSRARGSRKE